MSAIDRVSLDDAMAWVDSAVRCLETETTPLETAAGRVLARDLLASDSIPPCDCAGTDGFAVNAQDTVGAGTYNPLSLPATAVEAGEPIPATTDAVIPVDQAEVAEAGGIMVIDPVAVGANVEARGAVAEAGALLLAAGTCLKAHHLGLLAAADHTKLPVVRRPRVRLVIAARRRSGAPRDGNGPMLRALIARDGGIVFDAPLTDAFAAGADLVIVAGGTGRGGGDRSACALTAAGSLAIHGVALSPGETTAFGLTASGAPVVLLPGASAACWWTYELFAGRAIRLLGGRDPALPYTARTVTAARKIVSAIGISEVCPVRRLPDGRIEPLASFADAGLGAAAAADGFLIVAEGSEGHPAGAAVTAYFYDPC